MKTKITAARDYLSLRIYINGILHLEIRNDNHDGIQSWLEGKHKLKFFIEFYRKEGKPILLGYDEEVIWKKILALIDKNI